MNCEFCQSPVHIWFQCPKKPDGWKPARLATKRATPEITPDQISLVDRGRGPQKSTAARKDVPRLAEDRTATASGAATEQRAKYGVEAGTQALPVDPPKRGRPSTGFDKRAYNRQYMADRRAGKR